MYRKFKDCLLAPRNIADYVDEPKRKTFLYVTILLFIYILPMLVIAIFSNSISRDIGDKFVEDFKEKELHFVIEDYVLTKTDETVGIETLDSTLNVTEYEIPVVFVFDVTGENYKSAIELKDKNGILLVFTESSLQIVNFKSNYQEQNENNNSSGTELLANTAGSSMVLFEESYKTLDIDKIDFASSKNNNNYVFEGDITSLVDSIYTNIKNKLIVIIIIAIIIMGVSSYFISILFIAFLEKLIYRYLNLSFGKILKTTMLCSTPYVICCVVSSITGWTILEIVGDLIMIFYTVKAMTNYKIKYDGGIPIPNYMKNFKNQENMDENIEEKDEKGNEDNEL